MGTRSLTFVKEIYNGEERPIICMYRQYDGYPEGHGRDLGEFLSSLTIVNGISMDEKRKIANGIGCLTAQLVCNFKQGDNTQPEAGGIYLYPVDSSDCGEEYVYEIIADAESGEISVKVTDIYADKMMTFKSVNSYVKWLKNPNFTNIVDREDTIEEALRNREVTVAFTKTDNTKRIMRCTLNMDLIPEDKHPTGAKKKSTGGESDAVAVFDLDKGEWRSFKKSTIFEWK